MSKMTINKKYVGHCMTADYRVGDNVSATIGCALIVAIDGDNYTLELPDLERDEFIKKGCEVMAQTGVLVSDWYKDRVASLYDAGARFK